MSITGSGSRIDKNAMTHSSKMTVKKLNLVGEKKVVLEMLEDKQQRVRPQTAGACRIWVQKLANPENSIEVCLLKAVSVESKNNCREICEEKSKG